MSDKLQFVVLCGTRFYRSIDKLQFIGHRMLCVKALVNTNSPKKQTF